MTQGMKCDSIGEDTQKENAPRDKKKPPHKVKDTGK
jgi:hypothetical protein